MQRLKNKVMIVTGGASGIGAAICELIAAEGALVAITDINPPISDEKHPNSPFWQMDVTQEEQIIKVFKEISNHFGRIDVLVNNAGKLGVNKLTHEIAKHEWDDVINTNMNSVFLCTKHVVPYLLEAGGGSIINISSIYGIVGSPTFPPYHAAKAASRCMSKTDALCYAQKNIRVNSIHPGFILTPLSIKRAEEHPLGKEGFLRQESEKVPLKKYGEPIDVAYGVVYLASDESKYITGSELVIDGGYTAQ